MKELKAYQTTDGKIFFSKEDAVNHEHGELWDEINRFLESSDFKYNNGAHRTIVENSIIAWMVWRTK